MANGFDTYSSHMLLAADLPHDLGFLVSIYTDEAYYKDESGRADDKEFGGVSDEQFWIYNCKDAACTLEVAWGIQKDLHEHGMLRLPRGNPSPLAYNVADANPGNAH